MKALSMILVAIVVSFATWKATRMAMAQGRPQTSTTAAPTISISQARTTLFKAASKGGGLEPVKLGSGAAFAESHLRSFAVIADGENATVRAHASVADKRAIIARVWRLRVLNAQGQPVAGRVYADQVFGMEANGQKEASFEDVVATPPGSARVELALYAFRTDEGLGFLDDDAQAHTHLEMRGIKILGQ